MNEAGIQTLLSKRLVHNPPIQFMETPWAKNYELKIVKYPAKTLPPSKFRPQQLPFLLKHQTKPYHHKYSDLDVRMKMCDGSFQPKSDGYVAVCFYKPRTPKLVHFILVEDFNALQAKSKRNSVTMEDIINHPKSFNLAI